MRCANPIDDRVGFATFHSGRVAEWQTRTVQVRVSVRTWGFNSPLAHVVRCSVLAHLSPDLSSLWGATPQTPTVRAPSDPAWSVVFLPAAARAYQPLHGLTSCVRGVPVGCPGPSVVWTGAGTWDGSLFPWPGPFGRRRELWAGWVSALRGNGKAGFPDLVVGAGRGPDTLFTRDGCRSFPCCDSQLQGATLGATLRSTVQPRTHPDGGTAGQKSQCRSSTGHRPLSAAGRRSPVLVCVLRTATWYARHVPKNAASGRGWLERRDGSGEG